MTFIIEFPTEEKAFKQYVDVKQVILQMLPFKWFDYRIYSLTLS